MAFALTYLIIAQFLTSPNKPKIFSGENFVLVPVPLFRKQKRRRGFNQAELIAQELSRFFQIPLEAANLIKIRKTKSQARLNKEQREVNLKNSFALKNPAVIAGRKIILIDDVITTGATLEECAKALKQAGAKQVWGLAVAYEPMIID